MSEIIGKLEDFSLTKSPKLHGSIHKIGIIGCGSMGQEIAKTISQQGVDVVCLDSAHGHTRGVIEALKSVKKSFPKLEVIAGNVGTGAGAKAWRPARAAGGGREPPRRRWRHRVRTGSQGAARWPYHPPGHGLHAFDRPGPQSEDAL